MRATDRRLGSLGHRMPPAAHYSSDRRASYTSGLVLQGLGVRGLKKGTGKREKGTGKCEKSRIHSPDRGRGGPRITSHGPRKSVLAKRSQTPRNTKAENMKRPRSKVQMRQVANTLRRGPRSREANWPNKAILHSTRRPGSGWHRFRRGSVGFVRRLRGLRGPAVSVGCIHQLSGVGVLVVRCRSCDHPATASVLPEGVILKVLGGNRRRWDSNPRITDLQSAPLVHSGTSP